MNFYFLQESRRANRTLDGSGSTGETGGDCNVPMSPILRRVIDANHQHHRKCNNVRASHPSANHSKLSSYSHHNLSKNYSHASSHFRQKSYVDLPHATLDLSGGSGLIGNGKPGSSQLHNSTAIKSALELSTLV